MNRFEDLHADVLEQLPTCTRYINRSITGRVIESWEYKDGAWHDVTLRDQELERLEREIKRCERVLAKEA